VTHPYNAESQVVVEGVGHYCDAGARETHILSCGMPLRHPRWRREGGGGGVGRVPVKGGGGRGGGGGGGGGGGLRT